jgi:intracellular sulfur oxidation DsrE/DsrF family protein
VAKIGVHFAICQMATRRLAGQIAKAVGSTPDAIYDELVANTVPNGHMVAAGVIATTRAQEYGYTVLVAG